MDDERHMKFEWIQLDRETLTLFPVAFALYDGLNEQTMANEVSCFSRNKQTTEKKATNMEIARLLISNQQKIRS